MPLPSAYEIYRHLPKKNCGKCGQKSCLAFAMALREGKVSLEDCEILMSPKHLRERLLLKELLGESGRILETRLKIYEERCIGCGQCVISCPVNVSQDLNVAGGRGPQKPVTLVVKNGKVSEWDLSICRRFETPKQYCNVCVENCPRKALEFV
ncbi:MAG: 4Fe-4S binding protein [Archaeoglobi archaeon]|nr:4Fe-4S binding protein [Candidatus Mnemosynella sp.]